MQNMTLAEWLVKIEEVHPASICMGLDRIKDVAIAMGLLQNIADYSPTVITVGGTNGKGSCVTTLESLLLAQDKSVGAYTSPHFLQYNERIRINGQLATDQQITQAFEIVEQGRGNTPLTYFEYGTLAAFWIFAQLKVEFFLLEVGLGGRLDAVNIIDPDVAIITSIALDHQQWLGSDRESIGKEKAGIMRKHRPVICADENPPQSVLTAASELDANIFLAGDAFSWRSINNSIEFSMSDQRGTTTVNAINYCPLPVPSVVAALQALYLLDQLPALSVIRRCVESLSLTGRFQTISWNKRTLLLDVAHNPAAAEFLAQRLKNQPRVAAAIFGVMADKDYPAIVDPLINLIPYWLVTDLPTIDRAETAEKLQRVLQQHEIDVHACTDVAGALQQVLNVTSEGDTVLVFGSFYTVAAALDVVLD